mgnify:CR=1 FL=1
MREKAFLQNTLWMAIKLIMKSRVRVRKSGTTIEERFRQQIKDALRSVSHLHVVGASEERAGKLFK